MSDFCMVTVTFESVEQSKPIIIDLLSKKLVACVQTINITSSYSWNGEICNEPEVLVFMKTRTELFDKIKSYLLEKHPYEVPEILCIPIEQGSSEYLNWITDVTKQEG